MTSSGQDATGLATAGQPGGAHEIDALHANAVGSFSVEGEKKFANEWIEHSGLHFIACTPGRRRQIDPWIAGAL